MRFLRRGNVFYIINPSRTPLRPLHYDMEKDLEMTLIPNPRKRLTELLEGAEKVIRVQRAAADEEKLNPQGTKEAEKELPIPPPEDDQT